MTTDVDALIAHLEGLHVCEIDPSRETALKAADAIRSQAERIRQMALQSISDEANRERLQANLDEQQVLITRLKSMTDAQEQLIREHIQAQREAEERAEGLLDQHARDSTELRRLCGERDKAKARAHGLEAVLREIAEQEHVELMLDPTLAQRIARAALAAQAGSKEGE